MLIVGVYSSFIGRVPADMQTFQAVLEEGDPVLCETPLYAGVLPALRAKKADCIGTSGALAYREETQLISQKSRSTTAASRPRTSSGSCANGLQTRSVLDASSKYNLGSS